MNMISSFPLYSGRCHIVPGGTEAIRREGIAGVIREMVAPRRMEAAE